MRISAEELEQLQTKAHIIEDSYSRNQPEILRITIPGSSSWGPIRHAVGLR